MRAITEFIHVRATLRDEMPVGKRQVARDAVDILLDSVDRLRGLLMMRTAGAATIAQDENTSVVWGMPGQAVKLGAAEIVLPLILIAAQSLIFAAR